MQKQPHAADKRWENTRLVNREVLLTKPNRTWVFFAQALLVLSIGYETHTKKKQSPKPTKCPEKRGRKKAVFSTDLATGSSYSATHNLTKNKAFPSLQGGQRCPTLCQSFIPISYNVLCKCTLAATVYVQLE